MGTRPAGCSGLYDDEFIEIIRRLAQLGGNVLDVGSNIGFYGIRIARALSKRQTIFCFEPLAANFARLQENIDLNCVTSKIKAFNFGLSDREGTADITLREDFRAGSSTGNAAISISPEADQEFQRRVHDWILDQTDCDQYSAEFRKKQALHVPHGRCFGNERKTR